MCISGCVKPVEWVSYLPGRGPSWQFFILGTNHSEACWAPPLACSSAKHCSLLWGTSSTARYLFGHQADPSLSGRLPGHCCCLEKWPLPRIYAGFPASRLVPWTASLMWPAARLAPRTAPSGSDHPCPSNLTPTPTHLSFNPPLTLGLISLLDVWYPSLTEEQKHMIFLLHGSLQTCVKHVQQLAELTQGQSSVSRIQTCADIWSSCYTFSSFTFGEEFRLQPII